MKSQRIDIAGIRKEQIIDAAIAVITEQGIQKLSLSEIEQKAGMSRGQLTYYFPSKEDILLAIFDRLLQLMCERHGKNRDDFFDAMSGWEIVTWLLENLVGQPPMSPEFHCLQYTFLSQIGHRDDFRQRLATLYEEWRSHLTQELGKDFARRPTRRPVSPRAVATLIQAMLHGLAMQRAADPSSFDREEMLHLCLDVLGSYLWNGAVNGKKRPATAKKKRGSQGLAKGNGHSAPAQRRG